MVELCLICSEELTIKNIVNPECGHSSCKDCFWKWTKQKNSCPFCRKSLLHDDKELQDIQHMRGLLEHKTRIIREIEDGYDENDKLQRKKQEIKLSIIEESEELCRKKQERGAIAKNIQDILRIKNKISQSLGGTYCTYQHFKKIVEAREIKSRKRRKKIDRLSRFIPSRYQAMCMEVLKDIKILGMLHIGYRSCPCRECSRNSHLEKVYEINNKRKKRKKFRNERLREGSNFDLEILFKEELEQSDWASIPQQDQIMENTFRDYFFRDNRLGLIEEEQDIINNFTVEEERIILDRIFSSEEERRFWEVYMIE